MMGIKVSEIRDSWADIEALNGVLDWIKLSERQPNHGDHVLVSDGNFVAAAEVDAKFYGPAILIFEPLYANGYDVDWHPDIDEDNITHWMLLPNPPEEEKKTMGDGMTYTERVARHHAAMKGKR